MTDENDKDNKTSAMGDGFVFSDKPTSEDNPVSGEQPTQTFAGAAVNNANTAKFGKSDQKSPSQENTGENNFKSDEIKEAIQNSMSSSNKTKIRNIKKFVLLAGILALTFIIFSLFSDDDSKQLVLNEKNPVTTDIQYVGQVNIYSSNKEHLIRPILDEFEKETKIKVNLVTGKPSQLIGKLKAEGELTQADILTVADVGNIFKAKQASLLQPITSQKLSDSIPPFLISPDNDWFGFTIRARVLFYNPEKTDALKVKNYEDLARDEFEGEVLVRSSGSIYNQSLLASIIFNYGEEAAQSWAKAVAENMARTPQGGDTDQLRALASGMGSVASANTYYYALLLNSENPEDAELANKIKMVFPNQETTGTHINIRAMGITKYAKNINEAKALAEFLVSKKAQEFLAANNYEFPVVTGINIPPLLKEWYNFYIDPTPLSEVARLNKPAVEIFQKAGWQ